MRLSSALAAAALLMLASLPSIHSACPANPPPAWANNDCKVVIVGGGPGGMFSAYALRHLGEEVCIIDRQGDWWGATERKPDEPDTPAGAGKTLDWWAPGDERVLGSCANRVAEGQLPIRCMFNQMGVELVASEFDNAVYTRGFWNSSADNLLYRFNLNPDYAALGNKSLESALTDYAILATTNINPLTGQEVVPHPIAWCSFFSTTFEYLQFAIGQEAAQFLQAAAIFKGDNLLALDVCAQLEYLVVDATEGVDMYPTGGWSELWLRVSALLEASGVRFFRQQLIGCAYERPDGSYNVLADGGTVGWNAEHLILAVGSAVDVIKLGGNLGSALGVSKYVTNIIPQTAFTYTAFWPEKWWEPYVRREGASFRMITDGNCIQRSEFYGTPYLSEINGSRAVYTDDIDCIAQWKAIFTAGGLEGLTNHVVDTLRQSLGIDDIPLPTKAIANFRDQAWHWLGPYATENNVTLESVPEFAAAPLGKPNLCVVGSAFAPLYDGWVHAAWQSMYQCMETSMRPLLTDEAWADLSYVQAGCNGTQDMFDNEVWPDYTPVVPEGILPTQGVVAQTGYVGVTGMTDSIDTVTLIG